MSAIAITATVVEIDGTRPLVKDAVLAVLQELVDVHSLAKKPDPSWSMTDAQGHYHATSTHGPGEDRDPFPTLAWREEDLTGVDDTEDWITKRWYECRICGQEIEPAFVTTVETGVIPGPRSWQVEMGVPDALQWPDGAQVSVRLEVRGDREYFGLAVVRTLGGGNGSRTYQFMGITPLGQRPITR